MGPEEARAVRRDDAHAAARATSRRKAADAGAARGSVGGDPVGGDRGAADDRVSHSIDAGIWWKSLVGDLSVHCLARCARRAGASTDGGRGHDPDEPIDVLRGHSRASGAAAGAAVLLAGAAGFSARRGKGGGAGWGVFLRAARGPGGQAGAPGGGGGWAGPGGRAGAQRGEG